VEEGAGADSVVLLGEGDAAIADRLIEALDGRKALIGERLVDERPKVLGRLQFRALGWLEDEADTIGDGQVLRTMLARIVELKHDALLGPRADRLGKIGENAFEHLLADGVGDVPHRLARRRLDESGHIEPLETMMAERDWPLADRRPHPARDRLQANAVFVRRPDLNGCARMPAPLLGRRGLEFFLRAARSSSVAASGCRGRGCWIE
jgi:hypothetical protein